MKRGVNTVILIGNVGQDPETRYFPDGGAITNASLATSEVWRDKHTGEQKEKTEWHRLSFKDRGNHKLGAIAGEHIKKGSKIYVSGKLETRKWQDQSGGDRYSTEIVVEEFQFVGSKEQYSASGAASNGSQNAPQQSPPSAGGGDFDDDIPFSAHEKWQFA